MKMGQIIRPMVDRATVLKLPNLEMQSIRLLDLGDPALDPTTVPQTRRATDPDGRTNWIRDGPGGSGYDTHPSKEIAPVMVQVGVVTTRIQGWVHAVHAIGDQ
jgi:hypothetical protein